MNDTNENTTEPAVNTNNTNAKGNVSERAELESDKNSCELKVRSSKLSVLIMLSISIAILGLISVSFLLKWSVWVSGFLIVVFLILVLMIIGSASDYYTANLKLSNAEVKLKMFNGWPEDEKKGYYESLLNMNVENLNSYYQMVRIHAAESFMASLLLSVTGILIITGGLMIGIYTGAGKAYIVYISTASGTIMEIISGLLFYLYNKTVRQLKDYHDSLINSQNVFLSFRLIDNITVEEQKFKLIGKLIDSLNIRSQTNEVQ